MNKEIKIHYGEDLLELSIPHDNLQDYIVPRVNDVEIDPDSIFKDRGNAAVLEQVIRGKSVCVAVEDATRNTPTHEIIEHVMPQFGAAGRLLFIIATGSHSSDSSDNIALKELLENAVKKARIDNAHVHIHDCENDRYTLYGITKKGTPVFANNLVDEADVFVLFSDVKNHYFAGFSSPIKLLFPGVVHFDSIERNHSLTLDKRSTFGMHPLHPDAGRRFNPLARDIYDAYRLIVKERPVFSLCTVSYMKRLKWARFGEIESVVPEAALEVDRITRFTVKPADKIIVSPGGYPDDESLYIAQRALELTKMAVKPGGEILFVAECKNGIGPKRTIENFYNRLTAPLQDIINETPSSYSLYSHKPYKFAVLIAGLKGLSMVTSLDEETVSKIHIQKVTDMQKVIDSWIKSDKNTTISIFDGANKLAVYAKE